MRRRSITNSHPFEDTDLREQYASENADICEIGFELGLELTDKGELVKQWQGLEIRGSAVHEIWSLGRRPMLWSNMIVLSSNLHNSDHHGTDGGPIWVRVLCYAAKIAKQIRTGMQREFWPWEADLAAGRSVLGYLETQEGNVPEIVEPYRAEAVERLKGLEVGA